MTTYIRLGFIVLSYLVALLLLIPVFLSVVDELKNYRSSNSFTSNLILTIMILIIIIIGTALLTIILLEAFTLL